MASRTIIVNPKEEQKKGYLLANEVLETVIKSLQAGMPINSAFRAGKQLIANKGPEYLNKIHSNFGFGVTIYIYKNRSEACLRKSLC
jgi:nucleosome binding factor SPN SPT16 subunit